MSRLLTIDETAAYLAIHPNSVYNLIRSGKLPSLVIGEKSRRIELDAVEQYLSTRREGRNDDTAD